MPTTHHLRRTLSGTVAILLTTVLPLSLSAVPARAEKSGSGKTGSVPTLAEKRNAARLVSGRGPALVGSDKPVPVASARPASDDDEDDDYGSISGTVTDPDGDAVEGAEVWAYSKSDDDWITSTTTDSDGAYELTELDPGYYSIEFDAPDESPLAGEWWNNKTSYKNATYFHVSGGQDVEGKDAQLDVGGAVSGTVTNADGTPIEGVTVWAADTHVKSDTTAADGTYTIIGVVPGRQTLGFEGPEGSSLAGEWWNDKPYYDKADFFTVTAGRTVTGKDAALAEGGSIDGQVYDTVFDEGAEEVPVYVLVYDHGWHYVTDTETDEDGYFEVANLRTGLAYAVIPDDYWVTTDATATGVGLVFVDAKGKPRAVVNPKLSGSPEVGATLSLSRGSGSWSGVKSSSVWLDGDEALDISGTSYRLTADDLGRSFSAQVTASWNGDTMTATSLPTGGVVLAGKPVIKGAPQVGGDVWVEPGAWTEGTEFGYQWFADGKPLPNAAEAELVVPAAAAGHRLTVAVTGSLEDHATLTKTSAATAKALLCAPPTVTGTQAVGFTLGVNRGAWTSKTSFGYQWLRDGEPITNAKKSTYKVTATDAGTTLTVRVTGKRSGYATAVRESEAGGMVTTAAVPSITGSASVAASLTVHTDGWDEDTDFSYQWYANGKPISGETGESLAVGPAFEHTRLSVTVVGTRDDYATVTLTSAQTAKVLRAGTPTLPAAAAVGTKLSVTRGDWTTKTSFGYRWLRDGQPISKATKSAYTVTAADSGHAISVVVTGKRSGYTTVAVTSNTVTVG